MPDQPATLYSVATDPEATATTVGVFSKMAFRDQSTIGAYRQSLVERLFADGPRGESAAARAQRLARRKSVLDSVREGARALEARLAAVEGRR